MLAGEDPGASVIVPPTLITQAFLNGRPNWEEDGMIPGRHWWLNRAVDELDIPLRWPDVPADAYAALGHWWQMIIVIPAWDLVVVRTGDDREDDVFSKNEFLKLVLAVAEAP